MIRLFLIYIFIFSQTTYADSFIGAAKNLFKIDKIEVEGSKKVEAEAILEKMSAKAGENLNTYTLKNDIKKKNI